jgi:DNA-binding response OmpR family regulator
MTDPKRILIVDDEVTIREVLGRYLEREGFRVSEAGDGPAALAAVAEAEPALILLDLMLPGIDGLALARRLRMESEVPIIMLTARGELQDRVQGLESGADDYVVKPFSPSEVVARVKAVLRRIEALQGPASQPVSLGALHLDPERRRLSVDGRLVPLTAREFDLLNIFMHHPRRVFRRDQLIEMVWGYDTDLEPATVTVHIRRLREKIEADPSQPRLLTTVWGVGYRFDG